tara:strand:- start:1742 stop:1876 length:135 start_codon:yes stop_codon:yes gene_type:complete
MLANLWFQQQAEQIAIKRSASESLLNAIYIIAKQRRLKNALLAG